MVSPPRNNQNHQNSRINQNTVGKGKTNRNEWGIDRIALSLYTVFMDETKVNVGLKIVELDMLTPAEIASKTGTCESTWRNMAASGRIRGIKKGKQWLIPRELVKEKGYNV